MSGDNSKILGITEARRRVDHQTSELDRIRKQARNLLKIVLSIIGSFLTLTYIASYVLGTLYISGNSNLIPSYSVLIEHIGKSVDAAAYLSPDQSLFLFSICGLATAAYFLLSIDLFQSYLRNTFKILEPSSLEPAIELRDGITKEIAKEEYSLIIKYNSSIISEKEGLWTRTYSKIITSGQYFFITLVAVVLILFPSPVSIYFLIFVLFSLPLLAFVKLFGVRRWGKVLDFQPTLDVPFSFWSVVPFQVILVQGWVPGDGIDQILALIFIITVLALLFVPLAFGYRRELDVSLPMMAKYVLIFAISLFGSIMVQLSSWQDPLTSGYVGPTISGMMTYSMIASAGLFISCGPKIVIKKFKEYGVWSRIQGSVTESYDDLVNDVIDRDG